MPHSACLSRCLERLLSRKSRLLRSLSTLTNKEYALKILGLKSFNDNEIKSSFSLLQQQFSHDQNDKVNLNEALKKIVEKDDYMKQTIDGERATQISKLIDEESTLLSYDQYRERVIRFGEKLDPRVWNIGASFLFTGTSVGIIIPCMPLLVEQLGMPSYQFGVVVASFGLSKLLGNIPSGYLVEKYGRKPMLVTGLGMCAIGLGSIGLTLLPGFGTPWLIACRFVSGLGVSAFVAGGYMFVSDISTSLNRTRTMAPVMAGFSGGAALGPALGGVLIDAVGISKSYMAVGGLFAALSAMNYFYLSETMKKRETIPAITINASNNHHSNKNTNINSDNNINNNVSQQSQQQQQQQEQQQNILSSFETAFTSWKELSKNKSLMQAIYLNGSYWFAYCGTQMTILPLLMVSPSLHFSANEIGGCFVFMSVISFLSSQPSAYVADKFGKNLSIVGGCALLSSSMMLLPYATTLPELLVTVAPMALGATTMNATPAALVGDLTKSSDRAQALSLLRTAGDMGLLFGASCSGLIGYLTSLETALQCNGSIVIASMLWYASKVYRSEE